MIHIKILSPARGKPFTAAAESQNKGAQSYTACSPFCRAHCSEAAIPCSHITPHPFPAPITATTPPPPLTTPPPPHSQPPPPPFTSSHFSPHSLKPRYAYFYSIPSAIYFSPPQSHLFFPRYPLRLFIVNLLLPHSILF